MKKYYLRFINNCIEFITFESNLPNTYSIVTDIDLHNNYNEWKLDTINEQEKTCTIKRKEILTEEII